MTEEIVRCPYCSVGDHLEPMFPQGQGWFFCAKCRHTAMPRNPDFVCFCKNCGEKKRAA